MSGMPDPATDRNEDLAEQPGGMSAAGGLYDGFEGYKTPSEADQQQALRTALVVLDANVLLNLYRYTATTRDDLLRVLESVADRLWVPHQVLREFWRNRLSALGNHNSMAQQTRASLEKQHRGTTDVISRWATAIALDATDREKLECDIDALYTSLGAAITARQPLDVGVSARTHEDSVLQRLEPLLEGHVGRPVAAEEWQRRVQEGARRAIEKIPPGYMDNDKADSDTAEGAAGDYLVWLESVEEAQRRDLDLLIVTGDEKEDWWARHRADLLGPRVELVTEFRDRSGRQLHLMTPAQLLAQAPALAVSVNPSSLDDAARVGMGREESPVWTEEAVLELLTRLDAEGWEQAEVIRTAAARGGFVDRETVYEIGGYDDDRMLRGFTRPSTRLTRDMQAEGLIPHGVTPMLSPQYVGVRAAGFVIPDEVVSILHGSPTRRDRRSDEHVGKYQALWRWLRAQETRERKLSFSELEEDAGIQLPASSRNHTAHWYSYDGSAVARAIIDAGWHATSVDLTAEVVTLVPDTIRGEEPGSL
jgi:hypothetical protein